MTELRGSGDRAVDRLVELATDYGIPAEILGRLLDRTELAPLDFVTSLDATLAALKEKNPNSDRRGLGMVWVGQLQHDVGEREYVKLSESLGEAWDHDSLTDHFAGKARQNLLRTQHVDLDGTHPGLLDSKGEAVVGGA